MKHRVQAAADYKAADSKEADHTVLLKLKEGDEYKLVLNMQVTKQLSDLKMITILKKKPISIHEW